jgi:ADP-heptose:LPS heptosyltransferase
VRDEDRAALEASGIRHLGEELVDLADTAAVISLLDLVISVDSGVAHLAGALARPVWILLAFSPDWRWLLGREDSPWYPSARLFSQRQRGDWDEVIGRVADELRPGDLVAGQPGALRP